METTSTPEHEHYNDVAIRTAERLTEARKAIIKRFEDAERPVEKLFPPFNREATRAIGFDGRLLNQSPINLGYVINMLMHWAGPTCLRRLRTEFPRPVLDGDSVCAGGRVVVLSREGDETIADQPTPSS